MKRQRAREEGNVAKSQDLNSAVALLAALLAMRIFGPQMFESMADASRYFWGNVATLKASADTAPVLAAAFVYHVIRIVLPFLIIMLVAGVAANFIQVGFLMSPKRLSPNLEKVNPFTGFSRFVSLRSFVELVKSIFKLILIGTVVYITLAGRWDQVMMMSYLSLGGVVKTMGDLIFVLWFRVALLILALALLDYAYQRWQYEQDLRMTIQEAREEMKQLEGDPRVKQRVRQIQRQMAMQRMMAEVPEADVIITNPTTYAVALRYNVQEMDAPVVSAKGARLLAERIRELGAEHRVPIVEKPELARTLYRQVEVSRPIPENLYRTVAEVLRFVYEIDRRAAKIREREGFVQSARREAS